MLRRLVLFGIHADAAGAGFTIGADAGVERAAHGEIEIAAHGEIGIADFFDAQTLAREVREQTVLGIFRFRLFVESRAHLIGAGEHDQAVSSS